MSQDKDIFNRVKDYTNKNVDRCELMRGILGKFDDESKCYTFYKQDLNNKVESIVYVTQQFLEDYPDINALEKTVLNCLNEKKGKQVTFKTTGIDEMPMIQKQKIDEE